MEIYIARDGQKHGPYTEAQLHELLKSGRIRPGDLAWKSGLSEWVPVSSLLPAAAGAGAGADPAGMPPAGGIRLWNPTAAILWSLLFSPAFGAFLHAQNWRSLGDKNNATLNLGYAWGTIAFLLLLIPVLLFFPDLPPSVSNGVGIALLAGWTFSCALKQTRHIKAQFPNGYVKRPIWKPLAITAPLFLAFIAFGVVLAMVVGNASLSPQERAASLGRDVAPSILKTWHAKPELKDARIEQIHLDPADDSGREFTGTVDAVIAGEKRPLPIRVTYDPATGNISWQILPQEAQAPTPQPTPPTVAAQRKTYVWPLRPAFRGEWFDLQDEATQQLREKLLSQGDDIASIARSVTQFRALQLPFYEGGFLCEGLYKGSDGNPWLLTFIVSGESRLTLLDGTSNPIHELNKEAPIRLETPEAVKEYLRFFCSLVHAEEDNFQIVTSPDDLPNGTPDAVKASASPYLREPTVERLPTGEWRITGCAVLHRGYIFRCEYTVHPNGNVEMNNDTPVVENLPQIGSRFQGSARTSTQTTD